MKGMFARLMIASMLAGSLASSVAHATENPGVAGVAQVARAYRIENESRILNTFRDFLSLPNVSNIPAYTVAMDRNAAWIIDYLVERSFTSEIVKAGRAPYILASRSQPRAT
ncbi:MAG: hypothetical protein ACE1ZA_19100, partial [Pseudomonadales bacterium]